MSPIALLLVCSISQIFAVSVPIRATERQAESSEAFKGNRAIPDAKPSQWQKPLTPANKRVGQFPREGFTGAPSSVGKSNIVYGKGKVEQPKFNLRPQQKAKSQTKFTGFGEDLFGESDGVLSNQQQQFFRGQQSYDPVSLQKYMQKYANQLYNSQKHAGQLSEAQKHVLGQEVSVKKYGFPVNHKPSNKYTATSTSLKYSEPQQTQQSFSAQPSLQDYAEPITADKYPPAQTYQSFNLATPKPVKAPKKASTYSYDNSQAYTDYKTAYGSSLQPEAVNQFYSAATSNDKEGAASTGYEHHTAFNYGSSGDETAKVTGYKIPGAVALSLGHEDYSLDAAEDKHEQHAEPKYEFMYQVQDHEKHNHFGHSEARKGKSTWGKYYVQLPDGRFETVKYYADKSGYHAEVDFKGHAKHPSHYSKEHNHHINFKSGDEPTSYSGLGSAQSEDYN